MTPKEAVKLANTFTEKTNVASVLDLDKLYLVSYTDENGPYQIGVAKDTKDVGYVSILEIPELYAKGKKVSFR